MKKQPKKKFVLKVGRHDLYLYRRNVKNKNNSQYIITIDYSTRDCEHVNITFTHLERFLFEDETVKYETHLKYVRKMSKAAIEFRTKIDEAGKYK